MDVNIVNVIISDIRKELNSLTASGTGPSSSDTHQLLTLDKSLSEIEEVFRKANLNDVAQYPTVLCLERLSDVVNGFEDLYPDKSRQKESTTTGTGNGGVMKKIRSYLLKSNPTSTRLQVIDQIKEIAEELKGFASEALSEKKESKLEKWDHESEKRVKPVGREKEKKEIIDQLILFRNKNGKGAVPVVVTIVGVAGIGKTKLAELVCDDEEVKAKFGSPIWVRFDIHDTFDVESIAKRVIDESAVTDRKCYLLVLDDLRVEIREKSLKDLLHKLTVAGLSVGAILLTTHSNLVAKVAATASSVAPYALKGLNEEETWSLFQQILEHGASDSRNVMQDMGRKIVGKCRGVPLAIITMARLLQYHGSQVAEAAELEKEFVQELELIYYHELPPFAKLCFAYCSLFPKDYLIEARRLIQLWMGEGFLTPLNPSEKEKEETGREYFNLFRGRSIFQDAKEDEFGDVRSCRMHPLMHDLACFVAKYENINMDPEGQRVHDKMLRASFDFSLAVSCGIPKSLFEKAKKLRTILLPAKTQSPLPLEVKMSTSACDKIFTTLKSLRVLDLHDLGIKVVPSSIGELKNLRYLDLSQNNIEKLPSSITKLSQLQTLKLSQCHVLKELPKDFEDLISLRHLDIEGCLDLIHMPRGLNKLSSLWTLSHFMASKRGLGELIGLNNLRGSLEILHLERLNLAASSLNAKDIAYLEKKQHLQRLTLRWDHDDDEEEDKEGGSSHHKIGDDDKKSLECLEPHPNLRVLFIVGYKGSTLSTWLSSIQSLVKFTLYNCPGCEFLPPLPSLKILELRSLDSLEFIEGSSSSSSINTPTEIFPSLKELIISDCPKLKSWWKTGQDRPTEKGPSSINTPTEIFPSTHQDRPFFTCISKLQVQHCPKLTRMPLYPCLDERLELVGSSVEPLWDTIKTEGFVPFSKLKFMLIAGVEEVHPPPEMWLKNFTSLEHFHIRECPHLESLPQGMKHLSSLQNLTIENCPILDLELSRDEWKDLKNLRSLNIREIPKLESLPWGVENVISLQELELHGCPRLTSLPESIGNLTSLGRLVISECYSLGSLPKGMKKLESLHTLIIKDCPLLLPRCQRETGDDWPQIAHIKNILVKQTSQDFIGLE